jgi:hypothetical protein
MNQRLSFVLLVILAIALSGLSHAQDAWWNPDWTQRQKKCFGV